MFEVWGSAMHLVVVAVMAEHQPVVWVMSKAGEVCNALDVVYHESPCGGAHQTSTALTPEALCFPGEVFRTPPPLTLGLVLPLRDPLALHPAIDMGSCLPEGSGEEHLLAHLTGVGLECRSARDRAEHLPLHMRGGTSDLFAAPVT